MTFKNDKIFSFTMVKNEEDIIESFVRYNVNIFDGMIILDNGSSDSTLKFLKQLKNEGLSIHILEDKNKEYDQFNKRNELLSITIDEFDPDIIVPLDVDEFLISTDGNPRKILEKISQDTLAIVKWKNYVPDLNKDNSVKFIPSKITLSLDDSIERFYKIIITKKLVKEYHAKLDLGSHDMIYDEKYEKIIKRTHYPNLRLAHFPVRSKEQIISKIGVGWINDLHRTNRIEGESSHWQRMFNKLKTKDLENEDVLDFVLEYTFNNLPKVDLKEDPIDLTFCEDIDMKYTPDKMNPISNILESFEYFSKLHINKEKHLNDKISRLSRDLNNKVEEEKRLKDIINGYEGSMLCRLISALKKKS